jgi:long-chain acyl-CoA synthetase
MAAHDPVRGVRNLADLVRLSAVAGPERVALVLPDRSVSWGELDRAVQAFASGLLRRGFASGDRIAILLGNGAPFVISYFGALRAGLTVVPINVSYTVPELTDRLEQCTPRMVIADRASAARARAAAGADVEVVVAGESSYEAIGQAGTRADALAPPDGAKFDPESLAVLLFTAGTSGQPKAAMLTHRALLANIGQLCRLEPPVMVADDVVLVVLPLFHVYALNAALGVAAAVGAQIVLVERFDPAGALETIARHGVTNVPGAPPMYVAWSRMPDLRQALSGVRTLVSGAAPLSPGLLALVTERAGQPIWEGYGMTEAAPVVATTLSTGRPTPGSVGRPLPGLEVRLVDDERDPVTDGDPGEIELRGPNLFSGYWPDGSEGPDAQGWWRTGDVAYADTDGDLHLVDRRRDLVLVSGFNVYPYEVETVICTHPDVAEAAVVATPDPTTGSAVLAYVVPLPGREPSVESIAEHCRARLARFKCPSRIVIVPALPHSSTGKVIRARLRETAPHG